MLGTDVTQWKYASLERAASRGYQILSRGLGRGCAATRLGLHRGYKSHWGKPQGIDSLPHALRWRPVALALASCGSCASASWTFGFPSPTAGPMESTVPSRVRDPREGVASHCRGPGSTGASPWVLRTIKPPAETRPCPHGHKTKMERLVWCPKAVLQMSEGHGFGPCRGFYTPGLRMSFMDAEGDKPARQKSLQRLRRKWRR